MSDRCIKNIKIGDTILLNWNGSGPNGVIEILVTIAGGFANHHLLATNRPHILPADRGYYIESVYHKLANGFQYFYLAELKNYKINKILKYSNAK